MKRFVLVLAPALCVVACNQVARPGSSPGGNAPLYLTAARSRMVIEVTPTSGREPDATALALLMQRADERCQKPQGISVVTDPSASLAPVTSGVRRWTIEDLQAFEAEHRTVTDSPDAAVLYVAYVDGEHAANPLTLALSFGSHSIAVFKDKLGSLEGPALVHELGHQLGLVNSGAPMSKVHEDFTHRGHDTDDRCVMFWRLSAESQGEVPPTDYDDNCKYDLKVAGGK